VPAIAERLPAKYLVKEEAPKTISSPQQHEAYISRLLGLQRKTHRTAEETETAKLLIVLITDYEAKHVSIEQVSGIEVLKQLMDANGLRQKDLADDLGGESIVSVVLKGKRQLNRRQIEKLSQRFQISPAVFF
jgi:HTH-type transcriptional regulator / antitoxin HigA